MANKNTKTTEINLKSTAGPRTRSLASYGIGTEQNVDRALSAIFSDLADSRADYETTRYMLSAIGKKLTLENLKVRAGVYKGGDSNSRGFFLKA